MEPTLTTTWITTALTFVENHWLWLGLALYLLVAAAAFAAGESVKQRKMVGMSNRQFRRMKAK